jgi:hypothetical protein
VTAGSAIAALLLATLYAPLFHVHVHEGEAPLIHAHFPELEAPEDESVVHMERPHSHANARSIDVLTTTAPHVIHLEVVIQSTDAAPIPLEPRSGFVSIEAPRAHAPPPATSAIPRAPPAPSPEAARRRSDV